MALGEAINQDQMTTANGEKSTEGLEQPVDKAGSDRRLDSLIQVAEVFT